MQCAGVRDAYDFEKKRREAIDKLFSMSKHTRAHLLFAVREMVKDSMVTDPDMSEKQKKNTRGTVDKIWEDVVLVAEFKSQASLKGGRAAMDYEESAKLGKPPAPWTFQYMRAWFLYNFAPFDKSIYGKAKNPAYLVLMAISMFPFLGVRIAFFTFFFLLHITGFPADHYQIMNCMLTFKGTQFKSGGVILLLFGFLQYVMCVHPGDAMSCLKDGPGMNIKVALSMTDLFGSFLFCWVLFLYLPFTKSHLSPLDDSRAKEYAGGWTEIEDVEDMLLDEPERQGKPPPSQSRLACCRSAGSRRVLNLLLYDAVCFAAACALGSWLAYLDLKTTSIARHKVRPGGGGLDWIGLGTGTFNHDVAAVSLDAPPGEITMAMLRAYLHTDQARYVAFKARLFYNLLAMPFMFLMAPGLSMLVGLTRQTGYNSQGYCVPFTTRPPKQARVCGAGATRMCAVAPGARSAGGAGGAAPGGF